MSTQAADRIHPEITAPRKRWLATSAALALLILSGRSEADTVWSLSLQSGPTDPIASGMATSYSNATGTLTAPDILDLNGDGLTDFVTFAYVGNDPNQSWELTFATVSFVNANSGALLPGHYTGAQQAAFAGDGSPGLDFALNGVTPSSLSGSFDIYAAMFVDAGGGPTVANFGAAFSLFADGASDPLTGTFKFGDASIPSVPLPASFWLLASGLLIVATLMKETRGDFMHRRT